MYIATLITCYFKHKQTCYYLALDACGVELTAGVDAALLFIAGALEVVLAAVDALVTCVSAVAADDVSLAVLASLCEQADNNKPQANIVKNFFI